MGQFRAILMFAVVTALFLLAPSIFLSAPVKGAAKKEITILAQQFFYSPNRIDVNLGDELHIQLGAIDTVHGFYLEGYDFEAEIQPGRLPFKVRRPSTDAPFTLAEKIIFIADRPGKFRYRCSVTCGTLHPFMLGELVVHPNTAFHTGVSGLAGALLFSFFLFFHASRYSGTGLTASLPTWRLDLLKTIPGLKQLITGQWFQFSLLLVNLAAFVLFIVAGFFGSPIGNRNIIITIVWIFWWFVLITIMVPFGSRVWCMMCPLPMFGEWFQRRKFLGPGTTAAGQNQQSLIGRGKKWPSPFSNIWIQNILFLTMCSFSTILVTRPVLTAYVLTGMALVAFLIHFAFRKRTFCRFLCPIGGWMSIYSTASMVEVRARDSSLCRQCKAKSCAIGNSSGWGCPWDIVPSRLTSNNNCGMCLECIKTCRNNNMTIKARPFSSDLNIRSYDQAWMVFIMMTLSILYTAIFLGPWGTIKSWANVTEVGNWHGFFIYVAGTWFACLVLMPLLWYLASWTAKYLSGATETKVRDIFLQYSYLLVPLGLLSWIAFSLPLIMINYTHITTSLSDPLGWGWNLFGTADDHWKPFFSEYMHWFQIPLIIIGLWFSLNRGFVIARRIFPDGYQAMVSLIPFGVLTSAIALLLIVLFTG